MRYLRIPGLVAVLAVSVGLLAACSTVSPKPGASPGAAQAGNDAVPGTNSTGGTGAPANGGTVSSANGGTVSTANGGTVSSANGGAGGDAGTTATGGVANTATPAAQGGNSSPPPAITSAPLGPPAALAPLVASPAANEGQWLPAGRQVDGHAAVYETVLRPVGGQAPAGIAWMDTALLAAQLYSGSESPGGGPWQLSTPIKAGAAANLVAAFNGGFKNASSDGGYYTQGQVVLPLRVGAASVVIYRDGSVTVGQWGRDLSMTPSVVGVRQNLNLLVDAGQAVPGLMPSDTATWGATLGSQPDVWRSAVGVTADGALVYVAGPNLEITQLASLLVAAGVVRGMELDINTDWTCFATYSPATPTGAAGPSNGADLLSTMLHGPSLFFDSSWARDFFTMSARSGPVP